MAKPTLSLGTGSGTAVLSGITNFLQAGGDPIRVIVAMILGAFTAPFLGFVKVTNAISSFFATPFREVAESIAALGGALFQAPAGLVKTGFQTSEQVLTLFLSDSLAGLFAGPVAVGLVMLSMLLVTQYLQEPETGDTVPGLPFDVPDFGPLTLGVEEEDEDADEEGFN